MARREPLPRSQWPARRDKWAQHVAEWATGSFGQAEYCRRHKLDEATFSGWKRRFGWARQAVGGPGAGKGTRKDAADRSAGNPHGTRRGALSDEKQEAGPEKRRLAVDGAQVFLPLRVAKAQSDRGAFLAEVVLRNGRVLRVGTGSDPAAVGRLAAALERDGVPC